MYCGLSVKINMRETPYKGRILFVFVSVCVVGKNPNTPNWSTIADDAITWSSPTPYSLYNFKLVVMSGRILQDLFSKRV